MLLLADAAQAPAIGEWPPAAAALAGAFWPGGLTVVVPQRDDVTLPPILTAGARTIGLRVPDHDAPRTLAAAVGPIPTTSANRSGAPEAADAASIVDQLGDAVAIVLDGGPAHGGPPRRSSTARSIHPGSSARARSPGRTSSGCSAGRSPRTSPDPFAGRTAAITPRVVAAAARGMGR